jgi:hypothetical protein
VKTALYGLAFGSVAGLLGLHAAEPVPLLTIPVRVHLMQSTNQPRLNTTLTEADVQRIFGKVNMIWSQANVHFEVEAVRRTQAQERKTDAKDGKQPEWQQIKDALPQEATSPTAIDVCYVKELIPNGFYYGEPAAVKDTAVLTPVAGGIDEPIPRVTAHELGHALGLKHRQNVTNLMASKSAGFSLNQAEIDTAREKAKKFQKDATKIP